MKKAFKRTAAMLTAAAMSVGMLSANVNAAAPTGGDDGVMREGFTAWQCAEEMGLGLNLGNTMEAYWLDKERKDSGAQTIGKNSTRDYETCWGCVETTRECIDGMKEAGFSTVRIPVYWGNMMENDGTFTINEEFIGRVKEIVDYCRDDGLYVVINMHHYDEFLIRRYTAEEDLDGCCETIGRIWTQIAEYFKDYSDFLVFEGFNEYLGGGPLDENDNVIDLPQSEGYRWTNALNQTFVDAVRATGGNNADRVLIASGYWTNIDMTTSSKFVMPKDTAEDKLMVSVHYVDNLMYWINQIGGDKWKEYSIDQCKELKEAFTDNGIPVFIGECTASYPRANFDRSVKDKDSSACLEYMLNLMTDYGFVPVIWDTNSNFYERTDCKVKKASDAEVVKRIAAKLSGQQATCKGDVNGSGTVDVTDVSAVAAHIKSVKSLSDSEVQLADVNGDNSVDVTDLSLIAAHVKGVKPLE